MSAVVLAEIKSVLIALAAGMKGADTAGMLRNMEALDRLVTENRATLDGQLVHFLERRSYPKALDFIGGAGDVPRGTCAPKR